MFTDPIVEEVRAIKKAYAAQYNFDIRAMYEALKEKERQYADRLVECPPGKNKRDDERPGNQTTAGNTL